LSDFVAVCRAFQTSESAGEFSTKPFSVPTDAEGSLTKLWLNAAAAWKGNIVTGGCDEGCAAYIMVELRSASDGAVVPGYERSKCVLLNVDGLRLPLKWSDGETTNGTKSSGSDDDNDDDDDDDDDAEGSAAAVVGAATPPPAGSEVFLRIYFRDATIYAFGVA
jgi:hypothetical protein